LPIRTEESSTEIPAHTETRSGSLRNRATKKEINPFNTSAVQVTALYPLIVERPSICRRYTRIEGRKKLSLHAKVLG
jgi:hypothetical protein